MSTKIPTTIKLDPSIYDDFKILGIRRKISLQMLVEKSVIRYVNDEIFRNDMDSFKIQSHTPPIRELEEISYQRAELNETFPLGKMADRCPKIAGTFESSNSLKNTTSVCLNPSSSIDNPVSNIESSILT